MNGRWHQYAPATWGETIARRRSPLIIAMIGPPGAGKTTEIKAERRALSLARIDTTVISRDDIRAAHDLPYGTDEPAVTAHVAQQLHVAIADLRPGSVVFIDQCHSTVARLEETDALADSLCIETDTAALFLTWRIRGSLTECLTRNAARHGSSRVPDETVVRAWRHDRREWGD